MCIIFTCIIINKACLLHHSYHATISDLTYTFLRWPKNTEKTFVQLTQWEGLSFLLVRICLKYIWWEMGFFFQKLERRTVLSASPTKCKWTKWMSTSLCNNGRGGLPVSGIFEYVTDLHGTRCDWCRYYITNHGGLFHWNMDLKDYCCSWWDLFDSFLLVHFFFFFPKQMMGTNVAAPEQKDWKIWTLFLAQSYNVLLPRPCWFLSVHLFVFLFQVRLKPMVFLEVT